MLRKSVVILILLLFSAAKEVLALELGAVNIDSNLEQPLSLRIEILDLGDTRLQDVTVRMASAGDFVRLNTEWIQFLNDIRFAIESTAQGDYVVLTSNQIVSEPSLSLVLETTWPNGRLISDYTVLLDLPVFQDSQTEDINPPIAPEAERAAESPVSVNAPAGTTIVPEATTNEVPGLASEEEQLEVEQTETSLSELEDGQVIEEDLVEASAAQEEITTIETSELTQLETITTTVNDTLSDIALRVRPDTSVSIQQTMLALQELNPEAFIEGNINRMRSGQVLRIPNLNEIQETDQRDAVNEVGRQNQLLTDLQPLVTPVQVSPLVEDQPQAQLSIVTEESETIDTISGAGGQIEEESALLDRRIAELENQLALRQEESDRVNIEREQLNSRLANLESQIDAAQEIIRLQDLQLAQLQVQLAAAAARAEAESAVELELEASQIAPEVEISGSQREEQAGFINAVTKILSGNTWMLVFGIIVVILSLVVLLLRRNKSPSDDNKNLDELVEKEFSSSDHDEKELKAFEASEDVAKTDFGAELDDIVNSADQNIEPKIVNKKADSFDTKLGSTATDIENMNEKPAEEERARNIEKGTPGFIEPGDMDMTFDLGGDKEIEAVGQNDELEMVSDFKFELDDLGFLPDEEVNIGSISEVEESDILSDDETATKLELAYAYQKMGDIEGAKEILQEVIKEGSGTQIKEAKELVTSLDNLSE